MLRGKIIFIGSSCHTIQPILNTKVRTKACVYVQKNKIINIVSIPKIREYQDWGDPIKSLRLVIKVVPKR